MRIDAMSALRARADVISLARDAYRLQSEQVARAEGARARWSQPGMPLDYERESSFESIVRSATAAEITYVGDYHTNPESQRTFLRLLEATRPRVKRLAIGLEFVPSRHQRDLDGYLADRISERTFLDRIRYRRLWPYDVWPSYRPVLDFARSAGLPALALDALDARSSVRDAMDLSARENFAADRLSSWLAPRADVRILVQFGQLHVLPGNLPAAVDRALRLRGQRRRSITVSQNLPDIWFRLAVRGRDRTRAVQIRRDHYCVLGTPPLLEQESYRAWLDADGIPIRPVARLLARFLGARVPMDLDGVASSLGSAAEEAILALRRETVGRDANGGGASGVLCEVLRHLAGRLVDPRRTRPIGKYAVLGERMYRDLCGGRMTKAELAKFALGRWDDPQNLLRDLQRAL